MMKKSFLVSLAIVIVSLTTSNVMANQCTKSEIMTMIRNGFNKSEIDDICNQESFCCCQIKTYRWTNSCFLCDYSHEYAGKVLRWIPSYKCSNPNRRRDFRHRKKIVKQCVHPSRCGR